MTLQEKEALYLKAKNLYYRGQTIMTDAEFDRLEAELKSLDSSVVEIVGETLTNEVEHPSKMLSLDKIHVNDIDSISTDSEFGKQFLSWFKKSYDTAKIPLSFEMYAEPKYDGSSCNLIYRWGKLDKAATRGTGSLGTDITNKMSLIVPTEIGDKSPLCEIRGEVNIKTKVFSEKYADKFKNARNFVAGILGRDDNFEEIIPDFDFIAYELRSHSEIIGGYEHVKNTTERLKSFGFITPDIYKFRVNEIEEVVKRMYDFRINEYEYGLDGMVIKIDEAFRERIGETGHHPKWAIAIKFPPTEAITWIKSINWRIGQSGVFTPVANLDPVELDGTTVSNVTCYNAGFVLKNKLKPGVKLIICKSGDIIPTIKKILN